jgi:hypothetical protein
MYNGLTATYRTTWVFDSYEFNADLDPAFFLNADPVLDLDPGLFCEFNMNFLK